MKRLGKNAQRLRRKKNWTQEEMRNLGYNYRYYQKLENGDVNATLDTLVKLANTFQCKLTDLLK